MEPLSFTGSQGFPDDSATTPGASESPVSQPTQASVDPLVFTGSHTFEAEKPAPDFGLKKYEGPLVSKEALKTSIENIPGGLKKLGYETIYPFLEPKQAIAGATELAKGLYSGAKGALGYETTPEEQERVGKLKGVFAEEMQPYTSLPAFGKSMVEDPVGTIAAPAQLLTGLGAAPRALGVTGKLGKVAQAIEKVGEFTDPASLAIKAGVKAADVFGEKVISPATSAAFAITTGKSFNSLQDAEKAGLQSNPSFMHHFSGAGKPEEAVESVVNAIDAEKKQRTQDYLSSTAGMRSNQAILGYGDAHTALNDAINQFSVSGVPLNRAMPGIQEVKNVIAKWDTQKTPGNMSELDALKKDLGALMDDPAIFRSPESVAVVTSVKNKVRDAIAAHDPDYAKAMSQYEEASDRLNNINMELKSGRIDKKSATQAIKDITKANDTISGRNVIEHLSTHNPDLPFIIAGTDLGQTLPGGLRSTALGLLGAYSTPQGIAALSSLDPSAYLSLAQGLAGASLTSPKVAGGLKYGMGALRRMPSELEAAAAPRFARTFGTQVGAPVSQAFTPEEAKVEPIPPEDIKFYRARGGVARATGGRVMTAERMMSMAKRAKKEIENQTKALLDEPDERIVKALKVANEHI